MRRAHPAARHRRRALIAAAPRGLGLWRIEAAGDRCAALAGLSEVEAALGAATGLAAMVEPAVAVRPGLWGRGLAAEAMRLLIAQVRAAGLPAPAAMADAPNRRSRRMPARAALAPVGEHVRAPHPLYRLDPAR